MKIRLAYMKDEKTLKEVIVTMIKTFFPDTKVKDAAPKNGYLHTFLTLDKKKKNEK